MVMQKSIRHHNIRQGSIVADWIIYVLLGLLSLTCLYPLLEVFICSISDAAIVKANNSLLLWPQGIHFDAYSIVFQNRNIYSGFLNTLFYVVAGTSFQYLITVLTAYPLSLRGSKIVRPVMIYFTITMYFSGGIIPYFLLINSLGMIDSRWVMIIPYGVSVYNIIIMRTQFRSIPEGIREATMLEGAGHWTMLLRIYLPLSGAVTAVLLLFTAVSYWNMWYEPMIFFTRRALYPLQSILREILIDNSDSMMAGSANANVRLSASGDKNAVSTLVQYACIIVCTVPVLCIYPFAQKYFVKGVMLGSIKE